MNEKLLKERQYIVIPWCCICLQALDEHYLDVDAQFGGVDQRKIFMFAEKVGISITGYDIE